MFSASVCSSGAITLRSLHGLFGNGPVVGSIITTITGGIMKILRALTVGSLLSILFVFPAQSQIVDSSVSDSLGPGSTQSRDRIQLWLGVGYGPGVGEEAIQCMTGGLHAAIGSNLFTFRVQYAWRYLFKYGFAYSSGRFGTVVGIDALYGRVIAWRYGYLSASGGLGYVRGESEFGYVRTVGVPFEGRAFVTPVPYLGIGLIGTGNLNLERPYAALCLGVEVGRFGL